MTINESIRSRLSNGKFRTAQIYAEADSRLTHEERDLIRSLDMAFGNSGVIGGAFADILSAAVAHLLRGQDDERLDEFRQEVSNRLAVGDLQDYALPVTDAPVIVALDEEPLSVVLTRIRSAGGRVNLFVEGQDFPLAVDWR